MVLSSPFDAPVLNSVLSLDALLPAAFSPVLLNQESFKACLMNMINHAQADGAGNTRSPAGKAFFERVFVSLKGSSCSEVPDAERGCARLWFDTIWKQVWLHSHTIITVKADNIAALTLVASMRPDLAQSPSWPGRWPWTSPVGFTPLQ